MWLTKQKALNDVDVSMCNPIIVNQTNQSVVLFLDRGVLYNKQILAPGEAVGMTRKETAGTVVPYKIHAVVGDAQCFPTRRQSMKNLLSTAAIPTAFIVGTIAAASSAGTLAGPSKALSRVAGGVVVRGLVIDSAALAAGSIAAARATQIAERLIEVKPDNFAAKSGRCMPGKNFVVIQGGIDEPLSITFIKEKDFRQIEIQGELKTPMDTLQDKIEYYVPAAVLRLSSKKLGPSEDEIKAITAEEGEREMLPAIEEQNNNDEPSSAAVAGATAPQETEEDRQLLLAIAASAAAPQETQEDRQLRMAIEDSLKMQDQMEKEDEAYKNLVEGDDKRNPVVLF